MKKKLVFLLLVIAIGAVLSIALDNVLGIGTGLTMKVHDVFYMAWGAAILHFGTSRI